MSAEAHVQSGFSMPRSAPFYGPPPYVYEGNRIVNVLLRTTPETLQALVPSPMTPNDDGLLFVYVGQLNIVSPGKLSYQEAGVGVPVSLGDNSGQYAVVLYLDSVGGIVAGREIYGFPKKDAKFTFTEAEERVTVKVTRGGMVLVNATVALSERVDPVPQQPASPWFNLKLVPSVRRDAPPDLMQLTSTLAEGETQELYTGPTTLSFGSSVSDPLGDIPILEIVRGEFTIGGFTLGFGDVVYDYLAEDE
jgi:acetoacetate decarboxylase